MAADPTAAYRKQQGLGPITQSYDPIVVEWTKKAAAATGADPVVLLATAIQESGARRGAVGDQGTSFGPWQMHRGGALGSHDPAWANSYATALNRAQEFARLKVHGGLGAAAVQRPRDRALYAQGVESHLEQARRILGAAAPVPHAAAPDKVKQAAAGPAPMDAMSLQNRNLFIQAILNDAPVSDLLGLVQQGGGQGVPSPVPSVSAPGKGAPKAPVVPGTRGRVVNLPTPKIIGTPYHGTHTLGNWESDNAIDIAMPTGTPLYAPSDGVIGSQIGSLGSGSSRFAGLRVHLKTGGNELYYAHLSRLAVKAGQRVKAGQLIGYSGSANGVQHLHLGTRSGNPQVYA